MSGGTVDGGLSGAKIFIFELVNEKGVETVTVDESRLSDWGLDTSGGFSKSAEKPFPKHGALGVTTTSFSEEGDVTNSPLRMFNSFPIVRFSNDCSGVISSSILRGFIDVLICAGSVDKLLEDLVTLGSGVVAEELIVFKSLPTCMELVSSVAWIALRELRIFSIIVVGFSVVSVGAREL